MRCAIKKGKFCLSIIVFALSFSLLLFSCGANTDNAEMQTASPSDIPSALSCKDVDEPKTFSSLSNASAVPEIPETGSATDAPRPAKKDSQRPETENAPSLPSLCVTGSHLTDSEGNPVQLRGISTHGLAWYPEYVNEDCFRQLKEEWHANVIRLAMYTAEYGGYCTGGDQAHLKELVKSGVEYATAADMYVIIDWHILSDGNPGMHLEEAKAFFAETAELYAGRHNVLYEICNEPNGGTTWNDIKSYAGEIIPIIRTYDKEAVIIVGTPNWSQYVDQAAADPITGYDNIMYSLHFYAATHTDSLRNTMVAALNAGLPIFVSEYGICDASGNGAIDEYQAKQWIDLMDEYGVSYVAWNLSNKAETSAILSGKCSKTSGFTQDDLSTSGKWLYRMLTDKGSDASSPTPVL